MLKSILIFIAAVLALSLILLTSHHHEYITQRLPESLRLGKIIPPKTSEPDRKPTKPDSSSQSDPLALPEATVAQIQNASLGFERVMLINMPSRTDKLDAVSLGASLTGFNFTVVEGVRNEDVAAVSLPWNFSPESPNVHGCWRAHLNALRTVVRDGLASALIIEDDSDWDVNLKAQLTTIAAGTQKLLQNASAPASHQPQSPYGDDWDLLWLGHCASELRSDTARMLIHNDPTVRPPSKKWEMWGGGFNTHGPNMTNSTRIVSRANNAICTNGYAVSLKGARKILYYSGIKPNPDAIDTRLNGLCDSKSKKDFPDFDCLHVYPSLFNSYRKEGRADGDSDQGGDKNKDGKKQVKMRDHGYVWNIVYSVVLNLENLIHDREPKVQWPDDGWENERELDESQGVSLEWQEDGWDEQKAKDEQKANDEKKVKDEEELRKAKDKKKPVN